MSDTKSLFILDSPIYQGENATVPYSITFPWATTVGSSPTVVVYKNGTDVTSTAMPSGSHSASGKTLTLKPLTALLGGETYIIDILATIDSVVDEWFLEVKAVKKTTGRA